MADITIGDSLGEMPQDLKDWVEENIVLLPLEMGEIRCLLSLETSIHLGESEAHLYGQQSAGRS